MTSAVSAIMKYYPLFAIVCGLYFTLGSGFVQIRRFPQAMKLAVGGISRGGKAGEGGITPRQAVFTALASTIGTGNIVGTAQALAFGGVGSLFWLWAAALLGMAVKYAEIALSVRYRERGADGVWRGGPVYCIENGLGPRWRPLALMFGASAAAMFLTGMLTQANSIVYALESVVSGLSPPSASSARAAHILTGAALAAITAAAMAGGARSVGRICEKLIPFMGALYISAALITVLFHIKAVPHALRAVIGAALTPRSAAGGAIGGAFIWGVRRSVFSNEAGLGTSGMAHAAADTDDPAEHGLYGIFEVFADTIVVCTLTALAVITSGVPLDGASGSALVCLVFSSVFGTRGAAVLVFAALVLFAYSTILGWSLYGANCLRYLFGGGAGRYAALIFPAAVFIGSVVPASAAWSAADMLNALVSVPNFIMLFALSPEIFRMARGLENKEGRP